ncbi:MAG: M14 family metallopeptidase, partial [Bacteroidota bacterium]
MVRYFFLLLTLVMGVQINAQMIYHRSTIHLKGEYDLYHLQELGVAMDHGDHKLGLAFTSDFSEQELAIAREGGWKVTVLLEDIGQRYQDQNDPTSRHYVGTPKNGECAPESSSFATPQNYHGGSMGGFLTYSELLTELDEMYAYCQANDLDIMTPRADNIDPDNPTDFETFEGHYQQWIKLSDNPMDTDDTEPEILYTALHHAREPASMQQLVFFLWYLIENYERNPEVKAIIDNHELYFIPCLNPDGYLYNETIAPNGGGLWRKNRRDGVGVDLNRNYSYLNADGEEQWGTSGTNPEPTSETYPGTAPFSEPETRAVRYFVEQHNFQIALNNHTHGELLLYPFGYARNTETPDDFLFSQISAAMVRANGYDNIISADLYPASGDSDDFMYGMLTTTKGGDRDPIFAMTPEIGYSFWPAQADIEGICREMLIHNLTAAQTLSDFGLVQAQVPQRVNTLSFSLPYTLTRYGFSDGPLTVLFNPVSGNITTAAFEVPQTGLEQGGDLFSTSLIQLAETIQEGDSI